jgi:hypothetical protein
MMRAIFRTAASAALLAMLATFSAADDYGPAPGTPPPPPKPAGGPAFTDMQMLTGAGQAANGLQLTLTADQAALPEMPRDIGQPLDVQPTALHLLFRNVGQQPIVLDTYNLATRRLAVIVVGPEKETVSVARGAPIARTREPLPIDYPQIEPGNPFLPLWAAVAPLKFPGDFNSVVNVSLYKPGDYRVQVIYSRAAEAGGAHDAWQGVVVSNTLIFHIVGPPPPTPPEKPAPEKPPEAAPSPAPTTRSP